jgi:hypothetical protein
VVVVVCWSAPGCVDGRRRDSKKRDWRLIKQVVNADQVLKN